MVSFIQSNYTGFGSGIVIPGTGISLQNRGAGFVLEPSHPNCVGPSKRPFHTIIPAFVMKDGKPWLSFGVMGGSMQPQAHAQVIVNLVDFDMNLQEAGDAARMRHSGSSTAMGDVMSDGGTVYLESGIPESVREELRAKGHDIATRKTVYGGYQAILRDDVKGVYFGASESRKDGQAAGY